MAATLSRNPATSTWPPHHSGIEEVAHPAPKHFAQVLTARIFCFQEQFWGLFIEKYQVHGGLLRNAGPHFPTREVWQTGD